MFIHRLPVVSTEEATFFHFFPSGSVLTSEMRRIVLDKIQFWMQLVDVLETLWD